MREKRVNDGKYATNTQLIHEIRVVHQTKFYIIWTQKQKKGEMIYRWSIFKNSNGSMNLMAVEKV